MIDWSKTFSVSKLNLYQQCPFKYKKTYIDWAIPFKRTQYISRGLTIADTLEEIYKNAQKYKDINDDHLLALISGYWIPKQYKKKYTGQIPYSFLGYESPEQEIYYKQQVFLWIKEYIKQNPIKRYFGIETEFTLPLRDFYIIGKIDRIDYLCGGLNILDVKSGTHIYGISDNLQLNIYTHAVEQLYPKYSVNTAGFYYIKDGTKNIIPKTELNIDKSLKIVVDIISKIRNSEFPSRRNNFCSNCEVDKHECPSFTI